MCNKYLFRVRKSRLLDQLYGLTTVKLYSKPVVHNPSHPAVHKVKILLVPQKCKRIFGTLSKSGRE